MDDVFAYIEQHKDEYVEVLRHLCRQPSISAQGSGLTETADMLVDMLTRLGASAKLFEVEGGFPLVVGEWSGEAEKTLTFYNHYDVQPPEPLELWHSDPFGAEIREGRIWARGVADNKGNLVSRLCAIKAYQETRGHLPIHIKVLYDGEEEIGSPHLEEFVKTHKRMLSTDACIWESSYKDTRGRLEICLGFKGLLYVELSASGPRADLHSAWATIVPNPVWRLAWALSLLKDHSERVLIPGFYDSVIHPSQDEISAALNNMDFDERGRKQQFGLDHYLLSLSGTSLARRHYYEPTCNICGIKGGYIGLGSKTVLPSQASAKIDFRLVPDQRPEEVAHLLRSYLDETDFGDIQTQVLASVPPTKTAPGSNIAKVVIETARHIYGTEPVILRPAPATSPAYVFTEIVGVPIATMGVGHAGSNNHAPNENVYIEDYVQGIKHAAMVIDGFAEGGSTTATV